MSKLTVTTFAVELAELMNRYSPSVNSGDVNPQCLSFLLLLAGYSADVTTPAEEHASEFQQIIRRLGLSQPYAVALGSVFQQHLSGADANDTSEDS